jgi:hypothetical protein
MKHSWSSSFEHDGIANVVFTRCLEHPNARPLTTYHWPTDYELEDHRKAHEGEIKSQEPT